MKNVASEARLLGCKFGSSICDFLLSTLLWALIPESVKNEVNKIAWYYYELYLIELLQVLNVIILMTGLKQCLANSKCYRSISAVKPLK